jgi:hypothetical protein
MQEEQSATQPEVEIAAENNPTPEAEVSAEARLAELEAALEDA